MASDTDAPLRTCECYCIASGACLRCLDDDVAVYVAERFETHLVDEAGRQVLQAVQKMQSAQQPCSIPALYACLTGDSDSGGAIYLEAEAALMPLLSELVRIGVLSTSLC